MQKGLIVSLLLVSGLSVWAQNVSEENPNIRVSATAAPTSSIDLLQQSAKDSQIAAPASTKKARTPKIPPKPATTPTVSTTASSAPVSTATAPAVTPAPAAANTLDIPLPTGTSVQTKVAPAKPATPAKTATVASTAAVTTVASTDTATTPQEDTEETAADEELEYAMRLLEQSKAQAQADERKVPPPAAKNRPAKVPAANKPFNPNAFRPGVEWVPSKSTHFDIYTQKPNGSMGTANLSLMFETAYNTLQRFIPWMLGGKVRVFVYQDHNSYLRYEPEAKAWSGAMSYPTRGEIVVYDDPEHTQEMRQTFSHELTHIFTQRFFDKHNTGRIMTPAWLDEGLAVFVEDHMYAGRRRNGGPWDHDFRTLRFERDPKTISAFAPSSSFGRRNLPKTFTPPTYRNDDKQRPGPRRGKPVRLQAFEDFLNDDSLAVSEAKENTQNWYLQAYLMVRFLLNPAGGEIPSNRMKFEQFTRLIAQGEPVRDPSTGFLVKDSRGKQVYEPYSVEKALAKVYRYNSISAFEDAFWRWLRP